LGGIVEFCMACVTFNSAAIPAEPSVWPSTVFIDPVLIGLLDFSVLLKNAVLRASASMGSKNIIESANALSMNAG
jgi:hypothetical protein